MVQSLIQEYLVSSLSKNYDIQEYIIEKILSFYKYNCRLDLKIRQTYDKIIEPYFEEFYIINNDWISLFLSFYNYEKIFTLLNDWNGEITLKNLSNEISSNNIKQKSEKMPDEMRDKNVFNPKISNLNNINYYQNFILIDNNLFKKLSNDNGNKYDMHYNFEFQEPKEVNICFIENKFIYKLNHFSLGFGIVDQKNNYPLLNIDFIIILNKQSGYNYETEIKQLLIDKSIKNFFSSSRQIDFSSHDNNPKIIYDGTNNEIGKFYSLDNFLYENYFEINNYSNNSFEQPSIEENKFMNSNGNIKKGHINNSLINNTKCGNNVTRDRHNITNNNLSKYSTLNKKNNETEIIEENISIINESNRNFLNDIQEENISIKMSSNYKNGKLKMEINNFIDQKEKTK